MIAQQVKISGSAKGAGHWFGLSQASISYDHPFDLAAEHALNIDFGNQALGPSARVAVELNAESARRLAQAILAVLEEAEAGGYLERPSPPPSGAS